MWDEIIFNRENMSYDDSNRILRDRDEEDDCRYEEYLNEQRIAFENDQIETE